MLMWDIKLLLIDFFFFCNNYFFYFYSLSFNLIDTYLFDVLSVLNWQFSLDIPQNFSFFFGLKFCICISFLILIRGGTPRYRYDFLTKLGWLKFLSLILLIFVFSILSYVLY